MKIKIKKLNSNAAIPKYAHPGDDAGLDLTATSYEFVNGRHVYGTGVAIEVPKGYVGLIFPRSSIHKYDLRLTNAVGVLDSGYKGEIKFVFENKGMVRKWSPLDPIGGTKKYEEERVYQIGDRIGQLIIMPYPQIEFEEVDELRPSERGDGGFGSSGQ